jgi:hypothetical protein
MNRFPPLSKGTRAEFPRRVGVPADLALLFEDHKKTVMLNPIQGNLAMVAC